MKRLTPEQVDTALAALSLEIECLRTDVSAKSTEVARAHRLLGSAKSDASKLLDIINAARFLVKQARAAGLANVDVAELAAALGMP